MSNDLVTQELPNTLTRYFIFVLCNLRINNLAAWRRRYFLPARINFSRVGLEIRESSSSWRRKQRRRISRSTSFAEVLLEMESER